MLFKQPTPSYVDAEAPEKVQKLALKFLKGHRHVPYEEALKQHRLFSLTHQRIRGDPIAMFKIAHGVHLHTFIPQRATWPGLQVPPTERLFATSPIRLHNSGCPILEQTVEIVNTSSVKSFKTLLDNHWQSMFPKVPI